MDVLRLERARPTAVSSGADALDTIAKTPLDLVLLDLNLPDMEGWQVLEGLRQSKTELPVVILTSNASEVSRQRALSSGAIDYVVKPIAVRELAQLLARHLDPPDEPRP